jgi:hypothetical protein
MPCSNVGHLVRVDDLHDFDSLRVSRFSEFLDGGGPRASCTRWIIASRERSECEVTVADSQGPAWS